MYVSATSRRFSRERFTPAIRANSSPSLLALPLLVPRVRADDQHLAVPLDHAAAVTHRLDGRTYLHERSDFMRRPRRSADEPRPCRLAKGLTPPSPSSG